MSLWSEADIETLKKHYSTGETAMLAALLHRPACAVIAKANKIGLKKSAEAPKTVELIRELSKRPDGFRTAQLPGDCHTNSGIVWKQVQAGHLFKLTLTYKNVRYFDSMKSAEAYRDRNCAAPTVTVKHHGPARAPWKPDTPAHYPPGFKITVIPCAQPGFRTSTYSED
jgi:hypothetical protein